MWYVLTNVFVNKPNSSPVTVTLKIGSIAFRYYRQKENGRERKTQKKEKMQGNWK